MPPASPFRGRNLLLAAGPMAFMLPALALADNVGGFGGEGHLLTAESSPHGNNSHITFLQSSIFPFGLSDAIAFE